MTTQTETASRRGRTAELSRYATESGEERVLVGKRGGDGVVRMYDVSVNRASRVYLVEEGITAWAEVAAIRRDYLRQAERLGHCPMAGGVGRKLLHMEDVDDVS